VLDRLGGEAQRQFGHDRQAERDQACGPEPGHQVVVVAGDDAGAEAAAAAEERHAFRHRPGILDQERRPGERSVVGVRQRRHERRYGEPVDPGVGLVEGTPGDGLHLVRADLARPEQVAQSDRVVAGVLGKLHGSSARPGPDRTDPLPAAYTRTIGLGRAPDVWTAPRRTSVGSGSPLGSGDVMDGIVETLASTVVGLLVTDSYNVAKTALGGLWRRVHPERAATVEAEFIESRDVLLAAGSGSQLAQAVQTTWQTRLYGLLAADPALADEMARLLREDLGPALAAVAPGQTSVVTQTATATGHGRIYQAGGDQIIGGQ
jgi:hypothetical protein